MLVNLFGNEFQHPLFTGSGDPALGQLWRKNVFDG